MCIYPLLKIDSGSGQWKSLHEFLGEPEESYVTEVTGENKTGYQFHYISSTTNYLSSFYRTRGAATQGLTLALVRSLILNSILSAFVVDNTGTVLYQSEKNIYQFGSRQGRTCCEIRSKKTSWEAQEVFSDGLRLTVYREAG
jgi:uncharacterized membrane protein